MSPEERAAIEAAGERAAQTITLTPQQKRDVAALLSMALPPAPTAPSKINRESTR